MDGPPGAGYNPRVLRSLPLSTGLGVRVPRPRSAWLALAGLLAAALLIAPLTVPRAQAPAGLLVAPDEASALAAARAAGHPVEALADRTEFSQTFANPSGTLTLNESPTPVRVRRGDGTWTPVDLTLRAAPDGTVAPAASIAGVAFSGGGASTPLARIARDGDDVALGWPGALPVPTLDGPTATYANVLPGVDLRLIAQPLGFSTLLVVRSAQAARNPAVRTVRLPLATGGVTLAATAAGELSAVDGVDTVVFGAPAASMWDASGASRAPVGVRVSPGELDLLPDAGLLDSPATRFPVSIDPYVSVTGVQQAWTKVDACFPNQTYWNGANDSDPQHFGEVKVGRSPSGYGDPCDGLTYRSLFQMDTAKVAHKTIHSATFNVFETYAPACNAESIQLWWTGRISSSTDWSNQPGWNKQLDSWSGAHGYPPGTCSARSWVVFDVTSMVSQIAGGGSADLTMGLRTPSESLCHSDSSGNNCQWKKFDSGSISSSDRPFLSIEYNTTPNTPGGLFTNGSPFLYSNGQIPCNANANYVNDATPAMHANVSDPDDTGSSQPQPLTGTFRWAGPATSGSVSDGGRTPGSGNTTLATSASVPSGKLANGDSVTWSVVANDGIVNGAASATCHLTIDTTPVTVTPGITSTDGLYPPGGSVPTTPVGTPGAFTLDPGATTDVAGFLYGLNASTPWKFVAASGTGNTAAVTIVPPVVGDNNLAVQVVGLGGNLGPVQTYDVITGHGTTGSVHLAQYHMNVTGGTTVFDTAGGGHDGRAAGTFSWVGGHTGTSGDDALHFDSSSPSGYAVTQEPVVDTRFGYTVSAWVKLDDNAALYHVLTQDGVTSEAFALEYLKGNDRWSFSVAESDATSPAIDHALSDAAPKVGVWTHLVGVFCADPSCLAPGDTAPGRLYLYVDTGSGLTLQASQPAFSSPWLSTGGLEFGRGKFNGSEANYLNGTVDEVHAYWGDPCPQPAAAPAASTCSIP